MTPILLVAVPLACVQPTAPDRWEPCPIEDTGGRNEAAYRAALVFEEFAAAWACTPECRSPGDPATVQDCFRSRMDRYLRTDTAGTRYGDPDEACECIAWMEENPCRNHGDQLPKECWDVVHFRR